MPYQAPGLHKGRKARNARAYRARKKSTLVRDLGGGVAMEIHPARKPLRLRPVLQGGAS